MKVMGPHGSSHHRNRGPEMMQLAAQWEGRRRQRLGLPLYPHGDPSSGIAGFIFAIILVVLMFNPGWAAPVTQPLRGLGAWATGNEKGLDILAAKKSRKAGPLTLAVDQVMLTPHFTRVVVKMSNNSDATVALPTADHWRLTVKSGATLDGSKHQSQWFAAAPARWTASGIINFDRLPEGTKTISLTLHDIPGAGPITLADIRLKLP